METGVVLVALRGVPGEAACRPNPTGYSEPKQGDQDQVIQMMDHQNEIVVNAAPFRQLLFHYIFVRKPEINRG
jgi:hypothetical protein